MPALNPPGATGSPYQKVPYIWPFATKATSQYQRVDQGWDLVNSPVGDVYAVAAGTVSYAHDPNGFGQNYAIVTLDSPDPNGPAIYYGHNVPVAAEGSHVNQGDVVATSTAGPQGNATVPGWLEIGWWSGGPTARAYAGVPTTQGQAMKSALLNAPTKSGANVSSGGTGSTSGGNGSQPSTTNSNTPSNSGGSLATLANSFQDLSDPRDNLPFSAAFMGQTGAGQSGSFTVASNLGFNVGTKKSVMPATTLVRGGITELNVQGSGPDQFVSRPRGNFKCYFMMNPLSVSYDMNISTDIMPASQQSAALQNQAAYLLTQESVTFTIIFNRMYEVWGGNVHNPHPEFGGPEGPSDIGCRWDMRALERLLGMYDATQTPGSKVSTTAGVGTMGAGAAPPQSLPVQVVLGGQNSLQFQGQIVQCDYTYTLFDVNMIPIEVSADVGIMRLYNPTNSSAPIINPLIKQYGQSSRTTPIATTWGSSSAGATFNAGVTRGQVPGLVPR